MASVHLGLISRGGLPHFSIGDTWFGVVPLYTWGQLAEQGFNSFLNHVILDWCNRVTVHLGLISRGEPPHGVNRPMYTFGAQYGSVHIYTGLAVHLPHFSIGSTGLVQQGSVHLGCDQQGGLLIFSIGYTGLVQQGSVHLPSDQQGRAPSFLNQVILVWCSTALVHLGLISRGGPPHFSIGSTGLVQYGLCTPSPLLAGQSPHFSIGYTGLVQYGSVHLGDAISRGGPPHFPICFNWSAVVGFCTFGLNQEGSLLISQQVKLVWCSRALCTWAQLARVPPHFSKGYTDLVQQDSVHWGLISRGGPPHFSIGYTGLVLQHSTLWVYQWGRVSSFLNRLYWSGVVGNSTLGLDQQGRPSSFLNQLFWFGVVGLCTLGLHQQRRDSVVQQGYVHSGAMGGLICTGQVNISQQVLLVWCSRALQTGVHQEGRACSFLNCLFWFSVVGLCTCVVDQQGRASSFLNRLYWFAVVGPCTLQLDQLGRASSFLSRFYRFGVVGLCTLGVTRQGRASSFLNRLCWFGVVGLYTWGQFGRQGLPISQQVILVWCSRSLYTCA